MMDMVMEKFIHAKAALDERINEPDSQRKLVLVVVCVALLLDNMLYMVIVPIIPMTLQRINEAEGKKDHNILWNYNMLAEIQNITNTTFNDDAIKALNTKFPLLVKYTGQDERDAGVGFLFASKAIVQLFINPISGTLIDRMGYETPMIFGLSVIFLSTLLFAVSGSYAMLLLARSLQGVGSAFADTSGLAMIADRFKEEGERSKAQGIALAFISFGCLFAPPFGGFFYTYVGEAAPFLILSVIALVDGLMLRLIMKPARKERAARAEPINGTPIYRLIMDPCIAVCAGALVMANVSLAFIEPTIAQWMKETMNVDPFRIGAVWLPPFIPHVLGVYVTVRLMKMFPHKQWFITAVGLVLEGVSCLILPFCTNYWVVMIPLMIDCFGIALVDTAMLPTLGYLVDMRHTSVYGSVYAIADISYSLAYAFGPIVSDWCYHKFGFMGLNFGIFISNVLYAPVLILLKNVLSYKPFEEEEEGGPGPTIYPEGTALKPGEKGNQSYVMGSIKPTEPNGQHVGPNQTNTREPGRGRPNEDDGDMNRQYVQAGRIRSRDSYDSYDDNVGSVNQSAKEISDFRTYRQQ